MRREFISKKMTWHHDETINIVVDGFISTRKSLLLSGLSIAQQTKHSFFFSPPTPNTLDFVTETAINGI